MNILNRDLGGDIIFSIKNACHGDALRILTILALKRKPLILIWVRRTVVSSGSEFSISNLAMVTLTFYLMRKEKQLLVTVLVPTLIIAFLSALSAVIPNNSGEKYG